MKKYWLACLLTPLLGFPGSGYSFDAALEDPNSKCGNGCWTWLTSEPGFFGDGWIICGPAQMRDLSNSERRDDEWDDSVESLQTGPAAQLHVWKDENFTGPVETLEPGTILRSLENMGERKRDLDAEISSLQLECTSVASTP